jgi:hypothetical protein
VAIARASYKQQQDNEGVTEIVEMEGRGHALTIDHGWREVAETALAFVRRFLKPAAERYPVGVTARAATTARPRRHR